MKLRLLPLLACPACRSALTCRPTTECQGEIVSGTLLCSGCTASYPIVRGVPRFVSAAPTGAQGATADAFGWEWQRFSELDAPEQEQFLDWIYPIDGSFFVNKTILDAGCGMGRWADQAVRFGAADVVGVDISAAVEVAQRRACQYPNMHVVQADIYHLPLANRFDFCFSIGVLHHLPDPEAGFHSLLCHLAAGGAIHVWVYGRENNEWLVRIGNPIRERVSSRLPRTLLYGLSFGVAVALQPVLKLLYQPRGRLSGASGRGGLRLPYWGYLSWLAKYSLRHNHHVVFDHLVAPTAHYIRREEFESWFKRAGLRKCRISWRNENSWRGYGEIPIQHR